MLPPFFAFLLPSDPNQWTRRTVSNACGFCRAPGPCFRKDPIPKISKPEMRAPGGPAAPAVFCSPRYLNGRKGLALCLEGPPGRVLKYTGR